MSKLKGRIHPPRDLLRLETRYEDPRELKRVGSTNEGSMEVVASTGARTSSLIAYPNIGVGLVHQVTEIFKRAGVSNLLAYNNLFIRPMYMNPYRTIFLNNTRVVYTV